MTTDALLLIGRGEASGLETHAGRLRRRDTTDAVHTATYESEPVRELRDQLSAITADTVYAVPMVAAHSHETTDAIPRALAYIEGTVHYCEPPGQSPAITDCVRERASDVRPGDADVSLVLVAFGSSSKPHHRQMADYHAERLRAESAYDEVVTCFLLQNPAVECVRYNVSNPHIVAVPLFVTRTDATERTIPAKLDLDRGGIEYAEPPSDHPRVTDAIEAELEKQRVLATETTTNSAAKPGSYRRPVATDGEGSPR